MKSFFFSKILELASALKGLINECCLVIALTDTMGVGNFINTPDYFQ